MEDFGVTKEYFIAANAWSANKTYTISDPLISATSNSSQFISYNPNNYTDTMYLELCAAVIRVVSVLDGQITLKCMGDTPTLQLPITITYKTSITTNDFAIDAIPTSGSQNPISSDGIFQILDTINVYSTSTSPGWTAGSIVNTSADYSRLYVKSSERLCGLQLNFAINQALTSGSRYDAFTIDNNVMALVKRTYLRTPAISSTGALVEVIFNEGVRGVVEIVPRANIASGSTIYFTGMGLIRD